MQNIQEGRGCEAAFACDKNSTWKGLQCCLVGDTKLVTTTHSTTDNCLERKKLHKSVPMSLVSLVVSLVEAAHPPIWMQQGS